MRDFKRRLRGIEDMAGLSREQSYCFIQFGYRTYRTFVDCEKNGKACYKKGDFEGYLMAYEAQGKQFTRPVDLSSAEGQRILKEHGYEQINSLTSML